jgi:murein DD-endopeptidase MepM/ murein hydrolase activator NlpD
LNSSSKFGKKYYISKKMMKQIHAIGVIVFFSVIFLLCNSQTQELTRLNVITELNVGEKQNIELINGEIVNLTLLYINIKRDSLRGAIREASVTVAIDGEKVTIGTGNYNLPVIAGKIKIDCPVIKEITNSRYYNKDGILPKDARFRIWPKDSPLIEPGTFGYPLKQKWLASRSQSQNELAGLGWAEELRTKNPGYHGPHDFGGAEGMDEILSATDGYVVSANNEILKGYENLPGGLGSDVVWIVDNREWYYCYGHLHSVEPDISPGAKVNLGQKIGYMGKKGGSGGWVHLHFGVHWKNKKTGKWVLEDAYPYLWEAYVRKYSPEVIAIARPRQIAWTGQEVILDGRKSISLTGEIISYNWEFTDGSKAIGPVQKRIYESAGEYSEILKVTDSSGNVDFDFAYIQIFDRKNPEKQISTIHTAYYPSLDLKPGDSVTFFVRTFGCETGKEIWDFGDGSAKITVERNSSQIENKEYVSTIYSYSKPGHYVVKVQRINQFGFPAIGHLDVVVNEK